MFLEEALATLDLEGPDQVAELLRRECIQGFRQSICGCPVSKYLSRLVGVQVIVNGINARCRDDDYGGKRIPTAAQEFITRFDRADNYGDLYEAA